MITNNQINHIIAKLSLNGFNYSNSFSHKINSTIKSFQKDDLKLEIIQSNSSSKKITIKVNQFYLNNYSDCMDFFKNTLNLDLITFN